MATLVSISLIGPLAIHMFLPVMPAVKDAFSVPEAAAGAAFSVTLFVMAIATLFYGSLSDRYGRRPVLLSGLVLFAGGSVLCALAPSVSALIAGRIIQAIGAACGVTLARAIARDAYGTGELVRVIALLTMAYTLGPMIAPLVGGLLLDFSGWRSVFWFAVVCSVLIILAAQRALHETHAASARQTGSGGKVRDHLVLLAHPRFTAFVLQSGFASGAFLSMAAACSFLMKDYLGRSATDFALYFLLFPIGYFLGNLVSSRLSGRASIERMVLAGSLVSAAAIAFQSGALLAGWVTPLTLFVPGSFACIGQGLALPNAQVGAFRVMPNLGGTASGLGVFFQMMLGALFAQAYSVLADGTPLPMVLVVSTGGLLTLAAGVVAFALRPAT